MSTVSGLALSIQFVSHLKIIASLGLDAVLLEQPVEQLPLAVYPGPPGVLVLVGSHADRNLNTQTAKVFDDRSVGDRGALASVMAAVQPDEAHQVEADRLGPFYAG